jgi:hypothetical protein
LTFPDIGVTNANIHETTSRPYSIRFPRPGERCQHSGLSRGMLYQWYKDGRIKTVSLRDHGKRGVRLIVYESLIAAIESASNAEASS